MKRNVCSSRQRTCLFIAGRSLKVTLWSFTWLSTVLRDLSTYNLFMQILKANPRRPVEKEFIKHFSVLLLGKSSFACTNETFCCSSKWRKCCLVSQECNKLLLFTSYIPGYIILLITKVYKWYK